MSESGHLNNASTAHWRRSGAFLECLLLINLSFSLFFSCSAVDYIPANTNLKDGDTIISGAGNFELGFFTPGGGGGFINSTTNRYLAIWYKKISKFTTVWVANREFPVEDTSGLLRLNSDGTLMVLSSSNSTIWASTSSRSVRNPVAQLLDTGNFVIWDKNDENSYNYVWQSFDYPGDTLLPGMKLGKDLVTGLDRQLTSWKSSNDPSPGKFTALIDTNGYPQLVMKMGSVIQSRPGPWNGIQFSGLPNMKADDLYKITFSMNEKEIYYEYDFVNRSLFMRNVISPSGDIQLLLWTSRTQYWLFYSTTGVDICDGYELCGPNGICDINNSPPCSCLDKFEPSSPQQWTLSDWSGGCKRKTPLDCGDEEGFIKYAGVKLPDTESSWYDQNKNFEECGKWCKSNCSCTAYTNLDIRGSGSGCLQWFGNLIDIRSYTANGQDLYIRMASSELVHLTGTQSISNTNKGNILKVILPLVFGAVLVGASLTLCAWRKKKLHSQRAGVLGNYTEQEYKNDSNNDDQPPLFGLSMLVNATNNFSIENKLGEGGFGVVYKGVMEDGHEIAVKRLSKTSSQGLDEFKNEVICISKLQHRNLVKLRGCCIQGDEKMLVYEFMSNKSLDSFLFDESKSMILDWPKRFHIIKGIARGLLYLHQDSRLRIIHRDLKASNILLDHEMNPKISDFGLARSFGGNETGANTNRVVGTYGYMSPEYAADGLFSVKSDVFSFGVIVIEIISGKKNRGFFHLDQLHNLLGHAWRLYKEGSAMELMDASLGDSLCQDEILRSIQVGLLCAQQHVEDRPTMSSVVTMLDSKGALPQPKYPGFFTARVTVEAESSSSSSAPLSVNEVTITQLAAR